MSKAKDKFENVICLLAVQPISMNVFVHAFMADKYGNHLEKMLTFIDK